MDYSKLKRLRICSACFSPDCEETAWINVNGGQVVDGEGPLEQIWCPTCCHNEAELLDFRVGDFVKVKDQAAADAWGFEGELSGTIVRFGENYGDEGRTPLPDALLSSLNGNNQGRWIPLSELTKVKS